MSQQQQAQSIYAQLSDPQNQVLGGKGEGVALKFRSVDESYGISIENENTIVIEEAGVYFSIFFPQVKAVRQAAKWTADFWTKLNGVNVPNSNVRLSQDNSRNTDVIGTQGAARYNVGDRIQLWGAGEAYDECGNRIRKGVEAVAIQPEGEPLIPSVIATIYRIGA